MNEQLIIFTNICYIRAVSSVYMKHSPYFTLMYFTGSDCLTTVFIVIGVAHQREDDFLHNGLQVQLDDLPAQAVAYPNSTKSNISFITKALN